MIDKTERISIESLNCPLPLPHQETIVMGHGSGGKMMHDLIAQAFLPAWDNPILRAGNDAGIVSSREKARLAISTDAHVVSPLFFPGGDIGSLAVCGTVNDIAVMGAQPLYLTASFILEEGLPMETLVQVIASMRSAAERAAVQIVAGDTKVVSRGHGDGLYISTAGVGLLDDNVSIHGANAQPGDAVILSGTLGDHGIAVLAARGELGIQADLQSDIAPLNGLISDMRGASNNIHVLRDPTRGGLATTLNEIAGQSKTGIIIEEEKLPIRPAVNAASELLGFDPLYIANEGKLVALVAPDEAQIVLDVMHQHPLGKEAAIIGHVNTEIQTRVLMKTLIGSHRIIDILMGEMLPRIC